MGGRAGGGGGRGMGGGGAAARGLQGTNVDSILGKTITLAENGNPGSSSFHGSYLEVVKHSNGMYEFKRKDKFPGGTNMSTVAKEWSKGSAQLFFDRVVDIYPAAKAK